MRTIKWYVEMGLLGCRKEGEFEVEDDFSDQDIEEAARDEVFNVIGWGWEEEKKDVRENSGE